MGVFQGLLKMMVVCLSPGPGSSCVVKAFEISSVIVIRCNRW